jgi:hypothetical protein
MIQNDWMNSKMNLYNLYKTDNREPVVKPASQDPGRRVLTGGINRGGAPDPPNGGFTIGSLPIHMKGITSMKKRY